jgi:hypothetical protein
VDDFNDSLDLLRALGACHQAFLALANRVRSGLGVDTVVYETDLAAVGDGFQFSEYVSPDRADGRWTYWRLEVAVGPQGAVTIDAEALAVDINEANVVEVIARGLTLSPAKAPAVLVDIARKLCAANPGRGASPAE